MKRLRGLKRKVAGCSRVINSTEPLFCQQVNEYAEEQSSGIDICDARAQHLMEAEQPSQLEDWKRARLDRIVADHLLRCGYHETARAFVDQRGLGELVETQLFEEAQRIAAAIKASPSSPSPPSHPSPSLC